MSDFRIKLTLPPKAPVVAPSGFGGGPLGTGLQFFCLTPNNFADNGKRVCIWIPGLQPTDVVSWASSNTFDGGEQPAYENTLGIDSSDACIVVYTSFAGSTGSLTVTATVNGTPLDPLTISFPDACP